MNAGLGAMRGIIGRRSAGFAVLLGVLCVRTFAQSDADRGLAAAISGKRTVRVLTPSGSLVLRRPTVTEEGLTGHDRSEGVATPMAVLWSDVKGLQVRRSGAGRGALIGAGIGATLGLALGLASTRDCSGWIDMFCEATPGQVVLVTAIGGAAGGLLGAGIGALTRRWSNVSYQGASIRPLVVSIRPAPRRGWVFSLSVSL